MGDEKNIHHGHRMRMKHAMIENGIDGLNDHQILEIMLFYAVPKIDTNPIAHRLIERFGSLRNVLEADFDELREVNGIGDNAASLIKFSQMLAGRYVCASSFEDDSMKFTDTDSLRRYYEGVFLGTTVEQVRGMLVDDDLNMVKEKLLIEGSISKVQISTRVFTDFVIKNNCNRLVIAHNHPRGVCLPSKEDVITTKKLFDILKMLDISIVDHIIVGQTGSFSLRASDRCGNIWPIDKRLR